MALYGGQLVDVTTPDGRRLSLPADLAANFEGLSPVPPEPPPQLDQPPPIGAAPVQQTPLAPPLDVPSFSPPPPAPVVEQPSPVAAPEAAPAAPTAPPPLAPLEARAPKTINLTNKDLQKATNADVFNVEQAARQGRVAAINDLATVEADEATRIAAERVAVDDEAERLLKERNAKAQEFQTALDARMKKYENDAMAIKNTKIDREADHPVLGMAMVLLGGIGAALGGDKNNLAFDAFYKGIDRKVQGQMQDLEIRRGNLAMDRDQIGMTRDVNRDTLAEYDTRRIAELARVKEKIETIKAQSTSNRVIANANVAISNIDEETAKSYGAAAAREADKLRADQARRDQLAQAGAARAESKRQFDLTFNENRRQFDIREANDLLGKQAAATGASAKAVDEARQKAIDKNEEKAILFNGELLLQPEGQKMVEKAKLLEEEAKTFETKAAGVLNPDDKQRLREQAAMRIQKAKEIRSDAEIQHAVRAGTSGEREKMSKQLAETQTALTIIDDLKLLRDKHGSEWFNTPEGQALVAKGKLLELTVKDAFELGAIDNGSIEYLTKISGGKPDGLYLGQVIEGLGSNGPERAWDSLAEALESKARNRLGAYSKDVNNFRFKRNVLTAKDKSEEAAISALRDKSPLEAAAGEKRTGALGKAADKITDAFSLGLDRPIEEQRQDAAASTGDEYGLSEKQSAATDLQLRAYSAGKNAKDDKTRAAAQRSADILVGVATNSTRPELQNAMLSKLQTSAPELYEKAVSSLPRERQVDVVANRAISSTIASSSLPLAAIRDGAIAGNEADTAELVRRAAGGDRAAIKAVQDVASAKRGMR